MELRGHKEELDLGAPEYSGGDGPDDHCRERRRRFPIDGELCLEVAGPK